MLKMVVENPQAFREALLHSAPEQQNSSREIDLDVTQSRVELAMVDDGSKCKSEWR